MWMGKLTLTFRNSKSITIYFRKNVVVKLKSKSFLIVQF